MRHIITQKYINGILSICTINGIFTWEVFGRAVMDNVSEVEMNTKVEEIIQKLELPYNEYCGEFNEQMQNPEMTTRIGVEIDRKVEKIIIVCLQTK